MTLKDRLRQVIEEYTAGVPLARNYVLHYQLFLTDENAHLVGASIGDTATGKIGPRAPKPVDTRKRRVVLTTSKLKLVEKDIAHRRFLAGPEQPVVKHTPANAFMYQERDRE